MTLKPPVSLTRSDLLELSTEALIALTNPGFVKKAQKDLEAGQIPAISETAEGTVHAEYPDGNRATLPPHRALKEADCTCPASGLCRHRVTLVLAYQLVYQRQAAHIQISSEEAVAPEPQEAMAVTEAFWSPAQFADDLLEKTLAGPTLAQAVKLAQARPAAALSGYTAENPVPSAHLPMCTVRFFSRSSLAAARCDCKEGTACAHIALAVWAFRQAETEYPGQISITIEIHPPHTSGDTEETGRQANPLDREETQTLRQSIYTWLYQIWNEGSAQNLAVLEMGLSPLRQQCTAQGWAWVSEALENIWQQLQAQHARSSRFSPRQLLEDIARLWGRLHILDHMPTPPPLPPRQILGIGIKGELALDHLRLVSLGLSSWQDDTGEGVELVFADPDTQTIMVLERYWQKEQTTAATGPTLGNRRIAGYPLAKLTTSQIVTKAAKRRANGQLDLTANTRQSSLFPLSPKAWDELGPPIRFDHIDELAKKLRQQLPDFAAPVQALRNFHILAVSNMEVMAWGWDAANQTLNAILCPSGEDSSIILQLPHHPQAVDITAQALKGEWGKITHVAGTVRLTHGQLYMHPWAITTEQRAVILEAETSSTQQLPPPLILEAHQGYAETLETTFSLLIQWLRLGLRHQTHASHTRLHQQSKALADQGLSECATQLELLANTLQIQQEPQQILPQISRLTLLLTTLAVG